MGPEVRFVQTAHHFSKIAFSFLRWTVSAGLPPVRLSHDLNSTTLTRCSTCGCAAHTVTVLIPSGISPAQTESRIALSPRATASNSVSASTHAMCSMPSMSVAETRQDRLGTFGLYSERFAFCSLYRYRTCPTRLTTRAKIFILSLC